MYFGKRIRSFYARQMGSVGQRASKLLAVKVGDFKKKSAFQPFQPKSVQVHLAWIRDCPGLNHFRNWMASNFAAL